MNVNQCLLLAVSGHSRSHVYWRRKGNVDLKSRSLSIHQRPTPGLRYVEDLPKTRNLKIMRRVIRAAYTDEGPGDVSALANPQALDLDIMD